MRRLPPQELADKVLYRDRYQRALNINSNPGKVLLSVFNSETCPLLNTEIFAEYRDVFAREKFHFPAGTVDIVMNRLAAVSMNINAAGRGMSAR